MFFPSSGERKVAGLRFLKTPPTYETHSELILIFSSSHLLHRHPNENAATWGEGAHDPGSPSFSRFILGTSLRILLPSLSLSLSHISKNEGFHLEVISTFGIALSFLLLGVECLVLVSSDIPFTIRHRSRRQQPPLLSFSRLCTCGHHSFDGDALCAVTSKSSKSTPSTILSPFRKYDTC